MQRIPPWLRWLLIAILAGIVAAVVLLLAYPHITAFLRVDACLDSGGRWIEDTQVCEY